MIEIIGQPITVQLSDGSTFVGRLDAISDDSITISGTRISQSMIVAVGLSHRRAPRYCRGCGHFHIGLIDDCPDAPCGSYLCCIN